MSDQKAGPRKKERVGLAVTFAVQSDEERRAIELAWRCAMASANHWEPAFVTFGLEPVTREAEAADLLVYLGESSRFEKVAGEASCRIPVLFIKSTVEELLARTPGSPPRYRMCTGVRGIATALAQVAPTCATVDWQTLPWPHPVSGLLHQDEAERSYVNTSVAAFRGAALKRGLPWKAGLPAGHRPFSVFLTMHEPLAAILAETALDLWPQCTVLAADGLVSTRSPGGRKWPARLIRVRHWSPRAHSLSNRLFRQAIKGERLPDSDSAGMLFGAMQFLEGALAKGKPPAELHRAGMHPGPLGSMRLSATGRPEPERLVVLRGDHMQVVHIAPEEPTEQTRAAGVDRSTEHSGETA